MANILFANNALSTLRNALGVSQTTLVVALGTGELFPSPTGGDYFKLTIEDRRTKEIEIVHCVGRSGDSLTIERGKEDTTTKSFSAGATVANRFTRDTADAILDQIPSNNPLYLGAFATNPTTDNNGNALTTGMLYFNTSDTRLRFYTGGSWVDPYALISLTTIPGTFLLQDPSGSFNGVLTDFNLRYTDYSAATQVPDTTIGEVFLVTLDGVIQKAGVDYTIPVLGTIRFTTPPVAGTSFWGIWIAVTGGGPQGIPGPKGDTGAAGAPGTGDVVGPASVTADTIAQFSGTTGKLLKQITMAALKTAMAFVKGDVGLGSVDNTADTAKPISTATQTALDLKAPINDPTFTGTVAGVTKTMVGLGSVDNTADTAKPVSTAQQTALNLKADLASPTLTGVPVAPTAAARTKTTQLATTDFVVKEVNTLVENPQTGTTYSLVLTDAGKMVSMNNAAAITLSIPTNASVAFPLNTRIDICQLGAGQVSVSPTGITLQSSSTKRKLTGQYSAATLWKVGTDTWVLFGDIAT